MRKRSVLAGATSAAALLAIAPSAYAGGIVTTPITGLSSPTAIASADFDGNGYADLAIAQDGAVVLELSQRDGSFARSQLPAGEAPAAIATGDLDHDRKPDVATISGAGRAIDLNLQDGHGGWDHVVLSGVGSDPSGIAIGDLDGDGWNDLAVSDAGSDDLLLFVRDPLTGSYDRTTLTNVDGALGVTIGDATGDGRADVVTANGDDADTVSLFSRQADGSYTRKALTLPGKRRARAVAIRAESGIVVALQRNTSNSVGVFRTSANGSFRPTESSMGTGVRSYDGVASFDLLGFSVLAASGGGSSVAVFNGAGLETFRTPEDTSGIAVGDFDGDGRADVATLQRTSGRVAVVSHLVPIPYPAVCAAKASVTAHAAQCGVPATLYLSIERSSLSFGVFTPGTTKDYRVSTQATVLTTAGDTTLTVSDPGRLSSGANALRSPVKVDVSKSRWTAPVASDPVTIAFTQHIDAAEVLHAGNYASTVTFTLAMNTP